MSILDKIRKRFKKDKVADDQSSVDKNEKDKKDQKPKLVPFLKLVRVYFFFFYIVLLNINL
jgi:hypothetical protein